MRGNGVLERVKMPLALGNVGALAVALDQFIKTAAADGRVVAREKERRCTTGALFQIGPTGGKLR
jgi:hypothetical protein